MSALLSKTAEYGIRAVLYISLNQPKLIRAVDIAKDLKVPYHFLAKVIQKLVKAGILRSKRGKKGGLTLKKSPEKIKLIDIVIALNGDEIFKNCVLGLPKCSDKNPCSVHNYWKNIRDQIKQMLSEQSIKELLNGEFKI
jgi:Rrf2 family protein